MASSSLLALWLFQNQCIWREIAHILEYFQMKGVLFHFLYPFMIITGVICTFAVIPFLVSIQINDVSIFNKSILNLDWAHYCKDVYVCNNSISSLNSAYRNQLYL